MCKNSRYYSHFQTEGQIREWPSKLAEAAIVLACIREVLSSNLGLNADYPEDCRGFPQFL
jgi:hypothetical protein